MKITQEKLNELRNRVIPAVTVLHSSPNDDSRMVWKNPTASNPTVFGWLEFATEKEASEYKGVIYKIAGLLLYLPLFEDATRADFDESNLNKLELLLDKRDEMEKTCNLTTNLNGVAITQ